MNQPDTPAETPDPMGLAAARALALSPLRPRVQHEGLDAQVPGVWIHREYRNEQIGTERMMP
jgi:hypothetical protein